jgi:hypothetical protein
MDRWIVTLLLLLVFIAYAKPFLGGEAYYMWDVGRAAEEGSLPVFITPDLAGVRHEVYLGEKLWVVVQIRNAYSPCPLSIEIVDVDTGATVASRSATLNVCGGSMLGGMYYTLVIPEFGITEPVVEGKKYKIVARVGSEWGATTFTERHAPPAKISSITVFEGGRAATQLKQGQKYEVRVKVRNNGEADGKYTAVLYLDGVKTNETQVVVLARREGEAALRFTANATGQKLNITVAVYGVILQDAQSLLVDVIYPQPKFVAESPPEIMARVGEAVEVKARLKNLGDTCRFAGVTYAASPPADVDISTAGGTVAPGGYLDLSLKIAPREAGVGHLTLSINCAQTTDKVEIPLRVYAKLTVKAADNRGGAPPVRITINGREVNEISLPGGQVEVEAEREKVLGNLRYVFDKWSDGSAENPRTLTLRTNTELVALYKVQYYVKVDAPGARVEGWYDAGTTLNLPIQREIASGDTRKVFTGWSGAGCPSAGAITVIGPVDCVAQYREEYRVVVEDPQGRFGGTFWTPMGATFTSDIPLTYEATPDTRLKLADVEGCRWSRRGTSAVIEASRPARCIIKWTKEFKITINDGLGIYRDISLWVGEGKVLALGSGDVFSVGNDSVALPATQTRDSVRYVLAGWQCGGEQLPTTAQITIKSALQCTAQWVKEYPVTTAVYLDGREVARSPTTWLREGQLIEKDSTREAPPPGPLSIVEFDKWEVNGKEIKNKTLKMWVDAPLTIYAYYHTNNLPLYLLIGAVAGGATAAILIFTRRKKGETTVVRGSKTVEIEPIKEDSDTKVRETRG